MKGFIGMALAHAGNFLNSQAPFAVHLALSYDEEVGCLGVRELIADMLEKLIWALPALAASTNSRAMGRAAL